MSRRVIVIAALALAGCGGRHAAPEKPNVKLVPFDGSSPAALAGPAGTPAPACRAAQLEPAGEGLQFAPGTGQGATGGVMLVNRGDRACRLTGRAAVRFVGGGAAPRQQQRALEAQPLVFPKVAPPEDALKALAPGQGAVLTVDWDNW